MEALIPVLADLTATPMCTLPELMPAGTHVVAVHPEIRILMSKECEKINKCLSS